MRFIDFIRFMIAGVLARLNASVLRGNSSVKAKMLMVSQWHVLINRLRLWLLLITDGAVARLNAPLLRGWKVHRLIELAGRAWNTRKHGPQTARVPGNVCLNAGNRRRFPAIQTFNKCARLPDGQDYDLSMKLKPICRTLVMNPDRAMKQSRDMPNARFLIHDQSVTQPANKFTSFMTLQTIV